MADVRGKEVEKYKITPEMQRILKSYQRLKRVEGMLRYETEVKKKELSSLSEAWGILQQEAAAIEGGMPREPLRELEGMDFPQKEQLSEEQSQIRY
jgi:hypothetical protein